MTGTRQEEKEKIEKLNKFMNSVHLKRNADLLENKI